MEFKKLELSQRPGNFWRFFKSAHFKKSLIYIIAGAVAGVVIFYFTEGRNMNEISSGDIVNSLLIGGFFGFFITNSPCARGRC